MEPGAPPDVGADSGMAGKAFSVLRLAREGFMARCAIGFEFCMGPAQRAGRNQALHDALGEGQLRGKGQPGNREKAKPALHQYIWTATMWMIAVTTSM